MRGSTTRRQVVRQSIGCIGGLALVAHGVAADGDGTFDDVPPSHWASNAIETLADSDVVSGDGDGRFRPDDSLSRAEFAAMIDQAFVDSTDSRSRVDATPTDESFDDIDGHWAEDAIRRVTDEGWMSGYPDGTFQPEADVRIPELLATVTSGLTQPADERRDYLRQRGYDDYQRVFEEDEWAADAFVVADDVGLIASERANPTANELYNGVGETDDLATRAQTADVIYRAR